MSTDTIYRLSLWPYMQRATSTDGYDCKCFSHNANETALNFWNFDSRTIFLVVTCQNTFEKHSVPQNDKSVNKKNAKFCCNKEKCNRPFSLRCLFIKLWRSLTSSFDCSQVDYIEAELNCESRQKERKMEETKSELTSCNPSHAIDEYRRPFQCSICHVRFGSEENLNSHKLVHESNGVLKCKICDKQFDTVTGSSIVSYHPIRFCFLNFITFPMH